MYRITRKNLEVISGSFPEEMVRHSKNSEQILNSRDEVLNQPGNILCIGLVTVEKHNGLLGGRG